MTIAIVDDFDTGDIPRYDEYTRRPLDVGMDTVAIRMGPYIDLPTFRRPDATGEIPVIRPDYAPDETGIGIFTPIPISPAAFLDPAGTVVLRHATLYLPPSEPLPLPVADVEYVGRHRRASLLVRAWRRLTGAW